MGHVNAREIIAVHHFLELLDGRIDEKRWVGAPGTAPDDIWRRVVVPFRGRGDDLCAGLGRGHVGFDAAEALCCRRAGIFLFILPPRMSGSASAVCNL